MTFYLFASLIGLVPPAADGCMRRVAGWRSRATHGSRGSSAHWLGGLVTDPLPATPGGVWIGSALLSVAVVS